MWKVLGLTLFSYTIASKTGNYVQGMNNFIIGTQNDVFGDNNYQITHNVDVNGNNNALVGANYKVNGDNVHMFGPTANVDFEKFQYPVGSRVAQTKSQSTIQNNNYLNQPHIQQKNHINNNQSLSPQQKAKIEYINKSQKENSSKVFQQKNNILNNQDSLMNQIFQLNSFKSIFGDTPQIVNNEIKSNKKISKQGQIIQKQICNKNNEENIKKVQVITPTQDKKVIIVQKPNKPITVINQQKVINKLNNPINAVQQQEKLSNNQKNNYLDMDDIFGLLEAPTNIIDEKSSKTNYHQENKNDKINTIATISQTKPQIQKTTPKNQPIIKGIQSVQIHQNKQSSSQLNNQNQVVISKIASASLVNEIASKHKKQNLETVQNASPLIKNQAISCDNQNINPKTTISNNLNNLKNTPKMAENQVYFISPYKSQEKVFSMTSQIPNESKNTIIYPNPQNRNEEKIVYVPIQSSSNFNLNTNKFNDQQKLNSIFQNILTSAQQIKPISNKKDQKILMIDSNQKNHDYAAQNAIKPNTKKPQNGQNCNDDNDSLKYLSNILKSTKQLKPINNVMYKQKNIKNQFNNNLRGKSFDQDSQQINQINSNNIPVQEQRCSCAKYGKCHDCNCH